MTSRSQTAIIPPSLNSPDNAKITIFVRKPTAKAQTKRNKPRKLPPRLWFKMVPAAAPLANPRDRQNQNSHPDKSRQ